jgi:hypothetical protein
MIYTITDIAYSKEVITKAGMINVKKSYDR